MNVYDFDKTIFIKDSTVAFYLFEIRKNPLLLRYIFKQAFFFILYIFGFVDKTRFKQGFFCFLKGIKDIDQDVKSFWKKNNNKIRSWYISKKSSNDVVISASPYFLLLPICEELGIDLIASNVDKNNRAFSGINCYGEEKVRRFNMRYPGVKAEEFYSDSLSDTPMANIATNAYIFKNNDCVSWNNYKPSFMNKVKHLFISPDFLVFLIVGGINALNGVLFSYLFSLIVDVNIAFIYGYLCSIPISYLLNTFFVFHKKPRFISFLKFIVSYIPNFAIQFGLVYLFYNVLGINKVLVYTVAVVLAIPITFVLLKIYAFASKKIKCK